MKTFTHESKGGSYERIGVGHVQTDTPLNDMDKVVLYRSLKDGSLWARRVEEFEERFAEEIPF